MNLPFGGSRRCTAGLNHHAQLSGLHRVSPGCLAPSAVIGTVSAGSIGDQCICGIGNIHKRIRFSIPILQFPRRRHSQAPSIGGELHTAGIDGDFAIPFVVELHFTGIRPRTPNAGVINRAIARNGFAVVKRGNTSCPRRRFFVHVSSNGILLDIAGQRHRRIGWNIFDARSRHIASNVRSPIAHRFALRRRSSNRRAFFILLPFAVSNPVFHRFHTGSSTI